MTRTPQMVALAASRSTADVRPGGLPDLPVDDGGRSRGHRDDADRLGLEGGSRRPLGAGVTAVGNFGVSWRAQTPEVHETMREAFAQAAAPWLIDDQLVFPVEAVMVWASA